MKYNYYQDEKLFNKLNKEWRSKYIRYTVVDKQSMQPVIFSSKFPFNPAEHHLVKYFDLSCIKEQKIHNPDGLALLNDPAPQVQINVHNDLLFHPEQEQKNIWAILAKYYFIEKVLNPLTEITYNYLFNLALVLNQRSDFLLSKNDLIYVVESVVNKKKLPIIFEEKKTIYTIDFVNKLWNKYPDAVNYRIAFLQEVNTLKSQKSKQNFEPYFSVLLSCNQTFDSVLAAAKWLEQNTDIDISVRQIRRKLSEKDKVQALSLAYILIYREDKNCTISKIENLIAEKIKSKIPFTQSDIANESGLSLRTIKTYWSHFREKVNNHKAMLR